MISLTFRCYKLAFWTFNFSNLITHRKQLTIYWKDLHEVKTKEQCENDANNRASNTELLFVDSLHGQPLENDWNYLNFIFSFKMKFFQASHTADTAMDIAFNCDDSFNLLTPSTTGSNIVSKASSIYTLCSVGKSGIIIIFLYIRLFKMSN